MENRDNTWLNKNFLIAVDDSESARRAVQYAGYVLGKLQDIHVTLLHVIPEPDEDFFSEEEQKNQWLEKYQERMKAAIDKYHQMLVADGISEDAIEVRLPLRDCPSMAECILSERDEREYGTLIVGRRGLSRQEEFLFGSISSKIVNHARHCTVWVVE